MPPKVFATLLLGVLAAAALTVALFATMFPATGGQAGWPLVLPAVALVALEARAVWRRRNRDNAPRPDLRDGGHTDSP